MLFEADFHEMKADTRIVAFQKYKRVLCNILSSLVVRLYADIGVKWVKIPKKGTFEKLVTSTQQISTPYLNLEGLYEKHKLKK